LIVAPVFADTITFTANGTSQNDGPVSASASFTTSNGLLSVTLTNTFDAQTIRSAGQALSDISFTLSDAPGTLGSTTASGQLGNLSNTGGTVTYTTGDPTRWLGSSPNPGGFSISGNTVTLETIGGGQPTQMILPFLADGGVYGNVNNGIDNFNPFVIGSATFTLALSGVTSDTTISNVIFSFGTGPDTFVPGTPGGTQTPEPASVLLLASGLAGMAGLLRRKLRP
jgi:hypothetical protein